MLGNNQGCVQIGTYTGVQSSNPSSKLTEEKAETFCLNVFSPTGLDNVLTYIRLKKKSLLVFTESPTFSLSLVYLAPIPHYSRALLVCACVRGFK